METGGGARTRASKTDLDEAEEEEELVVTHRGTGIDGIVVEEI